jgi:hypothetical protein
MRLPLIGEITPIDDIAHLGSFSFPVTWDVTGTDDDIAIGEAAHSLDELARDTKEAKETIARALVSVRGKAFTFTSDPVKNLERKRQEVGKFPGPLRTALIASYWRAYGRFEIEWDALESDPNSETGPATPGGAPGQPDSIAIEPSPFAKPLSSSGPLPPTSESAPPPPPRRVTSRRATSPRP